MDWELVNIGDPAWDLAGVLQDFLVHWTHSMPVSTTLTVNEMTAQARHPLASLRPAIRAVWQGYRSAAGLESTEAEALLDRAVAFSAARLIQSVHELSDESEHLGAVGPPLAARREHPCRPRHRPGSPLRYPPGTPAAMTSIHADLRAIIQAVEILSPSLYVLRGERREVPAAPDARFVSALTEDLYQRLYLRPSSRQASPPPDDIARRDFLAAISAANSGRGTWEPSWTIVRLDPDGRVVVAKDGLTFWVAPEGVRAGNGELRAGSACRVWVGKELRNLVPGFYIALGDGEGDADDRGDGFEPLARYYWHLTLGAAAPFVRAATAILNAAGLPYRIKILREPIAYRAHRRGGALPPAPVSRASRRHNRPDSRVGRLGPPPRGPPVHEAAGPRTGGGRGRWGQPELRGAPVRPGRAGPLAILPPG